MALILEDDVNFYEKAVESLTDIKTYKKLVNSILPNNFANNRVTLYYNNSGKFSLNYICNDSILETFVDFRRIKAVTINSSEKSKEDLAKYLLKTLGKKCIDNLATLFNNTDNRPTHKFNLLNSIDESKWLDYIISNNHNNGLFSKDEISIINLTAISHFDDYLTRVNNYSNNNNLAINYNNIFKIYSYEYQVEIVNRIIKAFCEKSSLKEAINYISFLSVMVTRGNEHYDGLLIDRDNFNKISEHYGTFNQKDVSVTEELTHFLLPLLKHSDFDESLILEMDVNSKNISDDILIKTAIVRNTKSGYKYYSETVEYLDVLSLFKMDIVYMNSEDYTFLFGAVNMAYSVNNITEEDRLFYKEFLSKIIIDDNIPVITEGSSSGRMFSSYSFSGKQRLRVVNKKSYKF